MKIFVTGATGFIGVHLTKKLVKEGHDVTALLRTEKKRFLLPKQVDIIEGSLSIFEDETLVLPEFDVVVHLAGAIFAKSDEEYMQYNCEATKCLVQCIERQKWNLKRFVYASSLAAAGPSGNRIVNELDTPNPIDPYGRAKLAAEKYLATVTSFPTTSFRPTMVLGPGDENSLTIFKMAQFRIGMNIDGKPQSISFIDVDDLNSAIFKMIEDKSTDNKIYFVSHPDQITSNDLFETLGKVMDRKVFVVPIPKIGLFAAMKISTFVSEKLDITNQLDSKQYNQLLNNFMCSSELLQKDLGWKPQLNLEATLQKAYKGYKAAGKI